MKYVQYVLSKLQTLWTEAMYTKMGNAWITLTWGGPCNHCCSGKAISITYSECVCSLSYRACTAHAPYCHLWPVWLYNFFPHYLTNGTNFEKLLNTKCVFILSTTFSGIFLILRRNRCDIIKTVYWSSTEIPVTPVWF